MEFYTYGIPLSASSYAPHRGKIFDRERDDAPAVQEFRLKSTNMNIQINNKPLTKATDKTNYTPIRKPVERLLLQEACR